MWKNYLKNKYKNYNRKKINLKQSKIQNQVSKIIQKKKYKNWKAKKAIK